MPKLIEIDLSMKKKLSIDCEIIFSVPYFDNFLYHRGEIIELNENSLKIKYSIEVERQSGNETITHTTEIPKSYLTSIEKA